MEEKCPYVREKMGTNFLVSPNLMDFTAFSHAMGNWWGNPCISHIIKYTTECKSNGKKAPILWVKYEYQFSRFSKYDEFCRIFPETNFSGFSHSMRFPTISHALGNWRANPCISLMSKYTTGWDLMEKTTYFTEKVWELISQVFPIWWVSLCYRKFHEKTHAFPMWWSTP